MLLGCIFSSSSRKFYLHRSDKEQFVRQRPGEFHLDRFTTSVRYPQGHMVRERVPSHGVGFVKDTAKAQNFILNLGEV